MKIGEKSYIVFITKWVNNKKISGPSIIWSQNKIWPPGYRNNL